MLIHQPCAAAAEPVGGSVAGAVHAKNVALDIPTKRPPLGQNGEGHTVWLPTVEGRLDNVRRYQNAQTSGMRAASFWAAQFRSSLAAPGTYSARSLCLAVAVSLPDRGISHGGAASGRPTLAAGRLAAPARAGRWPCRGRS